MRPGQANCSSCSRLDLEIDGKRLSFASIGAEKDKRQNITRSHYILGLNFDFVLKRSVRGKHRQDVARSGCRLRDHHRTCAPSSATRERKADKRQSGTRFLGRHSMLSAEKGQTDQRDYAEQNP
jgi:hypothetical protein